MENVAIPADLADECSDEPSEDLTGKEERKGQSGEIGSSQKVIENFREPIWTRFLLS
jgi:hypothetical protein